MTFKDGAIHEYLFQDKIIHYAVISPDGIIQKNVELCTDIDNVSFTCTDSTIKTTLKIGEIEYKNNFSI